MKNGQQQLQVQGERPKGGLTDADLTKLNPEGQAFIRFCRDLTAQMKKRVAVQGTLVGCSVHKGEYRPKKAN